MIIKTSPIPNNEELSIKALDLIKHLGLGIVLEQPGSYNWQAQYNRMCYGDAEIILGMDEDVFFTRPETILEISQHMIENKVPFMAMRELSGVSTHRKTVQNAMDCDYNSFLMFTQPELIRPHLADKGTILSKHTPKDWIEPYWMIFRHLAEKGVKGEEFKGYTHADEISTVLTWNDKPFAIHTWFARDYTKMKIDKGDINQRQRILDRYEEVKRGDYKQADNSGI